MTTSHALRTAAAVLATLTLAGAAQAASPRSTLTATADAAIAAGVPGISIFVRDGSRTTVLARGYADAAAKRPLTSSDRFRIGSVVPLKPSGRKIRRASSDSSDAPVTCSTISPSV